MMEQQPNAIPPDSFLARYNAELARNGLTERKLIEELGVDRQALVAIENGYFPDAPTLARLAEIFRTTPEDLARDIRQRQYLAPFGNKTLITVVSAIVVLIAVGFLPWWPVIFVAYGILIASVAFMIRSYEIKEDTLVVQRAFWKDVYPITAASRAEATPDLIGQSGGFVGTHGLFSYTGYYKGPKGSFVAIVSDPSRCVLVHFEGKHLAVSPDAPDAFVKTLNAVAADKAIAPKPE